MVNVVDVILDTIGVGALILVIVYLASLARYIASGRYDVDSRLDDLTRR